MKHNMFSAAITSLLFANTIYGANINIQNDWQMFGSDSQLQPHMFNDSCVDIIWQYDISNGTPEWKVYVINEAYKVSSKYKTISSIPPNQGVWIRGNKNCNLSMDTFFPEFISSSSADIVEHSTMTALKIKVEDKTLPSDSVNFTITGKDADDFNLQEITEELNSVNLMFVDIPDYERKTRYNITVNATDESNNTTSQDITINITDIEDTYPDMPNDFGSYNNFKSGETWKGLIYKTLTSDTTGRVWLDRNLGASEVCTSLKDEECYGDYYQWGREDDGHQLSTSKTSRFIKFGITNEDSYFVTDSNDWTYKDGDGSKRVSQWSAIDGNGICPIGYRVPTIEELEAEDITNSTDAFDKLKFPLAGYRSLDGKLKNQGYSSAITSSSYTPEYIQYGVTKSAHAKAFQFYIESSGRGSSQISASPASGRTIRCIKN